MSQLDLSSPRLDLFQDPPRVLGSMNGQAFGSSIMNMKNSSARELAIYQQLTLGNIPSFLRRGLPISIVAGEHHGVFWTMPDFLAIGDDEDYLHMPMWPTTAQRVASSYGASLPTRKMVHEIRRLMRTHLSFRSQTKDMSSVATFVAHDNVIKKQLAGQDPTLGIDGHFKSVVIARKRPKKNVAIYGGYWDTGKIVQGPQIQMSAHTIDYLDYSHGIRFVSNMMFVDDTFLTIEEVLTHPELHVLRSDEGQYTLQDCTYPMEY